ncbi:MAG: FKBP-type peptidyl-prolyl cis-trans isomerase [bacterium]|nr:FKBP-type peptidyl-prolyl cis-trans isomerase [Candidatus Kapabacteria bacterium]
MKPILILLAFLLPVCALAQRPDTVRTDSGLVVIWKQRGDGERAKVGQMAIVHYTGKLVDGKIFDSSVEREPFAFRLGKGQVIKGWDQGIAMLRIGDKATLIIPPAMAYGAKGAGEIIPPNAQLIFDVELLDLTTESVGDMLIAAIDRKGPAQAAKVFSRLKKANFKGYYCSESDLNRVGYDYLTKQKKIPEAIAVFEINVEAYPNSANVYDSLGEAYKEAGNKEKAIANYERSLELDPKNANAVQMLLQLRAK